MIILVIVLGLALILLVVSVVLVAARLCAHARINIQAKEERR